MKIVIINGSARKGNTLTAINAFIKGASEKNEIEIIEPDRIQKLRDAFYPPQYSHNIVISSYVIISMQSAI